MEKGLAEELTKEFKTMQKVQTEKYLIEKQKNNPCL